MNDKGQSILQRYNGSLTREQLLVAQNKAFSNASRLYEDGKLLYENNRFERAYFLFCITNEELGKCLIIGSTIVNLIVGEVNWKRFWKRIRNHKSKTSMIEHMENVFVSNDSHFTNPKEIDEMVPNNEEFKMACLYSDMFQHNNGFFAPKDMITQPTVEICMKLTEKRMEFVSQKLVTEEILKKLTKADILQFRSDGGLPSSRA